MRTLPAILSILLLIFLLVLRLVFGVTIDFYSYIRTADCTKGTPGALDLIGIGRHSFPEAGWIIPFGVQLIRYFNVFLRAKIDAQGATFAPLLIDFNAAFHCRSPCGIKQIINLTLKNPYV